MKKLVTLLAALFLIAGANAGNFSSLGHSEETSLIPPADDECTATLYVNHDNSFENGVAWSAGGILPPYYGAFGEAFDLGAGNVECGALFLTQVGDFIGHPMDVYIWDGGVTAEPGEVLFMLPDVVVENIALWPSISQHDVEVGFCVDGEFTVGYWADFSQTVPEWFIAIDQNGSGGHPWTNIAPGIGYPTGWNDPSVVWDPTQSLGLGVYFELGASPIEASTWGCIKALFE